MRVEGSSDSLSEKWFLSRIHLLSTYTLPSLLAQTDRDFSWLLGVRREVPSKLVDCLQQTVGLVGQVIVADNENALASEMRARFADSGELISCRLDSDDVLSSCFVRQSRELAVVSRALNFVDGASFDARRGFALHRTMLSNPFISYCSKDSNECVLDFGGHSQISQTTSVIDIRTRAPMWIQVVHGSNLKNRLARFRRPVSLRVLEKNFPNFAAPTIKNMMYFCVLYGAYVGASMYRLARKLYSMAGKASME